MLHNAQAAQQCIKYSAILRMFARLNCHFLTTLTLFIASNEKKKMVGAQAPSVQSSDALAIFFIIYDRASYSQTILSLTP